MKKHLANIFKAWCFDTQQKVDSDLKINFSQFFEKNFHEEAITFRSKRVGVHSVAALARVLEENEQIKKIDLHENVIRDKGLQTLISDLFLFKKSKKQKRTVLPTGSEEFSQSPKASVESSVDLGGSGSTRRFQDAIDEKKKTISFLDVGSNDISNEGISLLFQTMNLRNFEEYLKRKIGQSSNAENKQNKSGAATGASNGQKDSNQRNMNASLSSSIESLKGGKDKKIDVEDGDGEGMMIFKPSNQFQSILSAIGGVNAFVSNTSTMVGGNLSAHIEELLPNVSTRLCLKVLILGSEEGELFSNKMNPVNGVELASILRNNRELDVIDLNRNEILGKKTQDAFKAFAKCFEEIETEKEIEREERMEKNEPYEDWGLTCLKLGKTNLQTASAVHIIDSLQKNRRLRILDLHDNGLTHDVVKAIDRLLIYPTMHIDNGISNLSVLLLQNNLLKAKGVKLLCDALTHTENMVSVLNLEENEIEDQGAVYLAELLLKNKTITSLDVRNNQIFSEGCAALFSAFEKNEVIHSFFFSKNSTRSQRVRSTNAAKTLSQTGVTISLTSSSILNQSLDNTAKPMSQTLPTTSPQKDGKQTKQLSQTATKKDTLNNNKNSNSKKDVEDGSFFIAKAIKNHKSLKFLELNSCSIGNDGFLAIGDAVGNENRVLTSLFMKNNHLSEETAREFCTLVFKNNNIVELDLSGNQMDHSTLLKLKQIMKRNKNLKLLKKPEILKKKLSKLFYVALLVQKKKDEAEKKEEVSNQKYKEYMIVKDESDQLKRIHRKEENDIQSQINVQNQLIEEAEENRLKKEKEYNSRLNLINEEVERSTKFFNEMEIEKNNLTEKLKKLREDLNHIVNNKTEILQKIKDQIADKKREKIEKVADEKKKKKELIKNQQKNDKSLEGWKKEEIDQVTDAYNKKLEEKKKQEEEDRKKKEEEEKKAQLEKLKQERIAAGLPADDEVSTPKTPAAVGESATPVPEQPSTPAGEVQTGPTSPSQENGNNEEQNNQETASQEQDKEENANLEKTGSTSQDNNDNNANEDQDSQKQDSQQDQEEGQNEEDGNEGVVEEGGENDNSAKNEEEGDNAGEEKEEEN